MRQGLLVVCLLLVEGMPVAASPAVLHDLVLQGGRRVGPAHESLGLVPVVFVVDGEGLPGGDFPRERVPSQAGDIGLEYLPGLLVHLGYPVSYLEPRVYELRLVLRPFQHGLPVHLHQLVDVPEAWAGLARGYGVAHPVGVYAGPLPLEVGNNVFVEGVCREYPALLQPVLVQYAAALRGKVGKVPAVQPYPVHLRVAVVYPVVPVGPYGVQDTAPQGVVGVHKEYQGFAQVTFYVAVEGLVLSCNGTSERGNVAVRHCPCGPASKHGPGEDVGGVGASCDYGCLCPVDGCPGPVRPPRAEFAHRLVGGPAYP